MKIFEEHLCFKCAKPIQQEESMWAGLHTSCFCSWFQIKAPEDFQDVYAHTSSPKKGDWSRITSSFFQGKFRKYSARLGSKNYLLKVQEPECPELPTMEYLCNQIARHLDFLVPDFFLIRFENTLDTFVCENFMGNFVGSNLLHIYRFLDSENQFTCEDLLHILEREVQHLDDIHRFVKICLFDALIGNHDRHGRNLAIIQSLQGAYLSPFYDNPSYLALEDPLLLGAFHEPRGAIATKKTQEPTMRDYVDEWHRLQFDNPIKEFTEQIDLSAIHHLVNQSFISAKRQQAFIRLIERRYRELCDAIQEF